MKTITISFLALCITMSFSSFDAGAQGKKIKGRRAEAIQYLNEIRKKAGLVPFTNNKYLQRAAQRHTAYMIKNKVGGHKESKREKGFTGRWPRDRARKFGYTHKLILENVTGIDSKIPASVDTLMSGVYNRFGFLSFLHDEIGIGLTASSKKSPVTYNMGIRSLSEVCRKPPREATKIVSGKALSLCFYKKIQIDRKFYKKLRAGQLKKNPPVVIWPPDGAIDVLPSFFEGKPDPLPDYGVSSFPVSVQFNPFFFKKVRIKSFRIFYRPGKVLNRLPYPTLRRKLQNVRLFHRKNDPQKLFTKHQFALFSLDPFLWKSWYEAVAVFKVDGVKKTYRWHFRTRDPGMPIYTVKGKGEVFPVLSNQRYAFYLPPTYKLPGLLSVTVSFPKGIKVKHRALDGNTLWVRIKAKRCQKIRVRFERGEFFLRVAKNDNIRIVHKNSDLYAGCPK